MSDYLIDGSTLEDIADAIRAKTGGSSLVAPEDMPSEIASIETGGGGSLPSSISKIDGGSFTPSSDTASDTQSISHSLGVVPKGFAIWTEDEISGIVATRYISNCYISEINLVDKNSNNYIASGAATMIYNGNVSILASNTQFTTATVQNYMNATRIRWNNGLLFYKAGKTYKWLVWA